MDGGGCNWSGLTIISPERIFALGKFWWAGPKNQLLKRGTSSCFSLATSRLPITPKAFHSVHSILMSRHCATSTVLPSLNPTRVHALITWTESRCNFVGQDVRISRKLAAIIMPSYHHNIVMYAISSSGLSDNSHICKPSNMFLIPYSASTPIASIPQQASLLVLPSTKPSH